MNKLRVLTCTAAVLLLTASGLTHAQGPGPEGVLRDQAALMTAGFDELTTGFTYQGHLTDADGPVDGTCTFWFSLYDEEGVGMPPTGGNLLDTIQTGLPVSEGNFTAQLDFGSGMFTGERRWLEILVDCGEGRVGLYPRQELTPAPYALYAPAAGAVPWSGVTDVPADLADGDDEGAYAAGTGLELSGDVFSLDASYRLPQVCAHGQIAEWDEEGQVWACGDDDSGAGGDYWSLTGNGGTNPSTQFVGTTDAADLRLAVNGTTALRLGATSGTANLIGGYAGNSVTAGVVGATIGGGGYASYPNGVTRDYGTVAGGAGNAARGDYATVAGGTINVADSDYAIIGGGRLNSAGGKESTIGGGKSNDAAGDQSTIAGGLSNETTAMGATVGGGGGNLAWAFAATVDGGWENVADSDHATVGGGYRNAARGDSSTVGGGEWNAAEGEYATIGGGYTITATGDYATVAGGKLNSADGTQSTVGGGADNHAGYRATVGGGLTNYATGSYSTVGGGYDNDATDSYATVAGGKANRAEGEFSFAAGHQAIADADGSFVWADNHVSGTPFSSGVPNRFSVRATGGVYLALGLRGDGQILWGCYVSDGDASWACTSDRNVKENLARVDGAEILARLDEVPIYTWNGIGVDPAVQHMGPMAQDFYAAFALGEDERTLATIDLDGVALAAIQELHAQSQEQAARIEALEAETASQQAQIEQLAARLAALESASPRPVEEEP